MCHLYLASEKSICFPSSVQEQLVSSVQHMLSSALSDNRDVIVHNLQANDVQINDELGSDRV